ncbi:3-deoxy-D-manno-octulosonic acid transferase, partial [Streptomyces caniscabiei]|uniref:3-deoxy-D-manno-octulosonic acid transferase n=1 Tax=Streptomyces caniscabiei TaxID=2746961 RepID=UPI0038F60C63
VAEARKSLPDLLLVLVPRHPSRGDGVARLLNARGEKVAQRGKGAMPDRNSTVYLADTLGELGLFYRLATLAFVGGSLVPHGGQNPIEPAKLGV